MLFSQALATQAIVELVSIRLVTLVLSFTTSSKDRYHRQCSFKQVTVSTFSASLQIPDPTSCSFLALLAMDVVAVVILAAGNQRSLTCCFGRRGKVLASFAGRAQYC